MIPNIQDYLSTFKYKNITQVPFLTLLRKSLKDSSEIIYKNASQLHTYFLKIYLDKTC